MFYGEAFTIWVFLESTVEGNSQHKFEKTRACILSSIWHRYKLPFISDDLNKNEYAFREHMPCVWGHVSLHWFSGTTSGRYLWWWEMCDWACGYRQVFPGSIWLLQETNPSFSRFLGVVQVVTLCLGMQCCSLFTFYRDIEWVVRPLQSLLFGSFFNTYSGPIDQDKRRSCFTSMSTTNCTFREPGDSRSLCLQTLWTWFEFGFSKDSLWLHFPCSPHLHPISLVK